METDSDNCMGSQPRRLGTQREYNPFLDNSSAVVLGRSEKVWEGYMAEGASSQGLSNYLK